MALKTISLPSRNYSPDTRTLALNTIPQQSVGVRFTFTRESWPTSPPTVLTVTMECSRDNGATWGPLAGASFGGGDSIGRDGSIATTSSCDMLWPTEHDETDPKGRPVKCDDVRVIFVNPVTLRTALTIEAF